MGKVMPKLGDDIKASDATRILVGMRVLSAAADTKGKVLSLILGEGVGMNGERFALTIKAGADGTLAFSAREEVESTPPWEQGPGDAVDRLEGLLFETLDDVDLPKEGGEG